MFKFVAINTLPTSFAHSYMAEASLKISAIELGIDLKIESKSIDGISTKLTKTEIEEADAVIIIVLQDYEYEKRFENKKIKSVKLKDAVINSKPFLLNLLEEIKNKM